jgi:hypothetical protein
LFLFPLCSEPGANDSNQIIVAFRVDDHRDPPIQLAESLAKRREASEKDKPCFF